MQKIAKLELYQTDRAWLHIGKRRVHGKFESKNGNCTIKVSNKIVTVFKPKPERTFYPTETLIHELVHFLLWMFRKDFRHTKKFYKIYNFLKRELK